MIAPNPFALGGGRQDDSYTIEPGTEVWAQLVLFADALVKLTPGYDFTKTALAKRSRSRVAQP
jgi:hypothetical protein